jgi:hypothetical protein
VVDISGYVGKADGDVWSISIVDANGAPLFGDQASATYDVEPPPCHNLVLDL